MDGSCFWQHAEKNGERGSSHLLIYVKDYALWKPMSPDPRVSFPAASLPVPLIVAGLRRVPSAALVRPVRQVWRRMGWRHPKLMTNLARLEPALVRLELADAPHIFTLRLGPDPDFQIFTEDAGVMFDACVRGTLAALVDLLEGRVDGDALFFTRDIQITGKTEVIVGLRNTLDREDMDVFSELVSLCGPFETPARLALGLAGRVAQLVRQGVESLHRDLHRETL